MTRSPAVVSLVGRHNSLVRHYGPDSPEVAQARRALELARTEEIIRDAIEQAPPLDAATIERLRSLIPAPAAAGGVK